MTIRITDLIDTSGIIEAAMSHKLMRVTARMTKLPNADTAIKCAVNAVEDAVVATVAAQAKVKVQEAYDMHEIMEGAWADSADQNSWESAMDDKLEEAIEEFVPNLSANWLGEKTIDSGLHEEGGIQTFCELLGKEYFRELTYNKTAVQILSSAGIMRTSVEAALEEHINLNTTGDTTLTSTDDAAELNAVIAKIGEHIGKDYDQLLIFDDFDQVTDSDDILAQGAGERLGLDKDDVAVLQFQRIMHGAEVANVLSKEIEAFFGEKLTDTSKKKETKKKDPAAKKPPAAPKAPKPPKAPPAPLVEVVEDEAADAEGGAINASVLQALKTCGAIDTEMAAGMGVSRATYNNWSNGKTEFELSQKQTDFLRGQVVERVNILLEALATIDGSEAETIF